MYIVTLSNWMLYTGPFRFIQRIYNEIPADLKVNGGQGLKIGTEHAASVISNNNRTQNISQQ